jgi:hypothetical protein
MDRHNHERISVIYFENRDGHIIVAPDRSRATPPGFERKEATTLREIDRITAILNRQDQTMFGRMWQQEREQMIREHDKHRTKLRQRLLAVDCSRGERLFILSAFAYFDRKEKEYDNFKVRGYFAAREFDSARGDIDRATSGKQLSMPKLSDRLSAALSS